MTHIQIRKKRIVVVGLGIAGMSLLDRLSQFHNMDVIGIDQGNPPYDILSAEDGEDGRRSSRGETRLTRISNFESEGLDESARGTIKIYQQLEREIAFNPAMASVFLKLFGEISLFKQNGTLIIGPRPDKGIKASYVDAHGESDPVQKTIDFAVRKNIKHDVIETREMKERFPDFLFDEEEENNARAYYEPESGTLMVESCLLAHRLRAESNNARLITNMAVTNISDDNVVHLWDGSKIEADDVIVCAGPWLHKFLPPERRDFFKIQRQVLGWFPMKNLEKFSLRNTPNFVRLLSKSAYFYGTAHHKDGVKIAKEDGVHVMQADDSWFWQTRTEELKGIFNAASRYICGLQFDVRRMKALACSYTVTDDNQFFIDKVKNTWVVSACSGHGFKHMAYLMSQLADFVAEKKDAVDLRTRFGWLDRYQKMIVKRTMTMMGVV